MAISKRIIIFAAGLSLLVASCNLKKRVPESSPTEGKLVVYCAESVSPAVTKIADQFMNLYSKAQITVVPVPTRVAIAKLLNGEATVVVASRYFNQGELDVMKKYKIEADSLRVALDGIAVIVNARNHIPRLNTDQLRNVFAGKTKLWGELYPGFQGRIIPALESPNSGTLELFKDMVLGNENFTEAYPCTTMANVYTFVGKTRNAIGLVSSNWLNSGPDIFPGEGPSPRAIDIAQVDSSMMKYVDPNSFGSYYYPYQAHVYRHYYPLTRPIYFLTRDLNDGLGAGFLTFAASASGQQIFLNNGLVPATMPVRLVQLNDQPL
jgi:ABC-type phosphate transport system substrate-binding protein